MILAILIILGVAFAICLFVGIYYNYMAVEMYRQFHKKAGKKLEVNLFTYQNINFKYLPPTDNPTLKPLKERFDTYRRNYQYTILIGLVTIVIFGLLLPFVRDW